MNHRKSDLSLKEYLNILRQWLSFAHHFIVGQETKRTPIEGSLIEVLSEALEMSEQQGVREGRGELWP